MDFKKKEKEKKKEKRREKTRQMPLDVRYIYTHTYGRSDK